MPAARATMVIWTLAKKDLRLLVRDARALIILLAMPVIFILVLGVSLGENFGQKPAAGLKVTVLDLDAGRQAAQIRAAVACLTITPNSATGPMQAIAGVSLVH